MPCTLPRTKWSDHAAGATRLQSGISPPDTYDCPIKGIAIDRADKVLVAAKYNNQFAVLRLAKNGSGAATQLSPDKGFGKDGNGWVTIPMGKDSEPFGIGVDKSNGNIAVTGRMDAADGTRSLVIVMLQG